MSVPPSCSLPKGGQTDNVFFFDVQADGKTLDDKRDKIGADDDWQDLDVLRKAWPKWNGGGRKKHFKDRTANAFFVPKSEIEENAFDLSINRYKQIVHQEEVYDSPKVILARLKKLESGNRDRLGRTGGNARMRSNRKAISEVVDVNPRIPTALASELKREVDFVPMAQLSEQGYVTPNGSRKAWRRLEGLYLFRERRRDHSQDHALYGKRESSLR
ncbi:MAG: hypothetical protein R3C56_31125 [Pirellulaceae bacterium]